MYKAKHSKELWGRLGLEEAQKNLISFFCVCVFALYGLLYVLLLQMSAAELHSQAACDQAAGEVVGLSRAG